MRSAFTPSGKRKAAAGDLGHRATLSRLAHHTVSVLIWSILTVGISMRVFPTQLMASRCPVIDWGGKTLCHSLLCRWLKSNVSLKPSARQLR